MAKNPALSLKVQMNEWRGAASGKQHYVISYGLSGIGDHPDLEDANVSVLKNGTAIANESKDFMDSGGTFSLTDTQVFPGDVLRLKVTQDETILESSEFTVGSKSKGMGPTGRG